MIECFLKVSNKKIRKYKRIIKALYFAMKINPLNTLACFDAIEIYQDKISKEKVKIMDAHFKLQTIEKNKKEVINKNDNFNNDS